jgi:hypothetical protein
MNSQINFVKNHPLNNEKYNRNKGIWIYGLHPEWNDNNNTLWKKFDKCMSYINDTLIENNLNSEIIVWGTDDDDIYNEFGFSNKDCFFVTVKDGEIIGKIESISLENVKDHFVKVIKKIETLKNIKIINHENIQEKTQSQIKPIKKQIKINIQNNVYENEDKTIVKKMFNFFN